MVAWSTCSPRSGAAPRPGSSAYDADYAAIGRLKKLADHYAVPLVLVHHVRRAGSDDFLAEISGTNGIAGAADTTIVLKRARGQADGVLYVTGRDVDEWEYALSFQPSSGSPGPHDHRGEEECRRREDRGRNRRLRATVRRVIGHALGTRAGFGPNRLRPRIGGHCR